MTDPQFNRPPHYQPAGQPGGNYLPAPQPPAPRKHRMRNTFVGLVAGAVALVVVAVAASGTGTTAAVATHTATTATAPTDSTSSASDTADESVPSPAGAPTEDHAAIGDTVTVSQDGVEVGEITVTNVTNTSGVLNSYVGPPVNGHYLTVSITAKASGTQPFEVNPFYFYMRDRAGARHGKDDGNGMMSTSGDALNATNLNPGESISGTVTIDVDQVHGAWVYAPPATLGKALASWSF